jgi:S-adenosylmethionine decarboxylase
MPAMQGLHLTADLCGCPCEAPLMTDKNALRELCLQAVTAAGLQPVGELFHRFAASAAAPAAGPVGVTGVVLLAESHLAVHTWPEMGGVTVDVYVCNFGADNSERAQALMAALVSAFEPAQVQSHALKRGVPEAAAWAAAALPQSAAGGEHATASAFASASHAPSRAAFEAPSGAAKTPPR